MSLSLANFKQMLPQLILIRGQDYYRAGNVVDLSLEDEGIWFAQVVGSETYEVHIEQSGDGTLNCACTCPYEYGEHCKHVAAVLYAIEETFPEYLEGKRPQKQGKKRETRADKLRATLNSASEAELRAFLFELASKDRAVYNRVLLQFGGLNHSRTGYDQMVKDALHAGRGEYGIIDYRGSTIAAKRIDDLLEHADELLLQSRSDEALPIYQAVAGNVVESLENADDSNGHLNDCLSSAIEGIEKCATRVSTPTKHALFSYCLNEAQRERFKGWDWRWDLIDIAATLVETPEERATLFKALDVIDGPAKVPDVGQESFIFKYQLEKTAQIRLKVIEQWDGKAAADTFIQANLHVRGFKELVIERHIERGELHEAKTLVHEAIQDAESKHRPGLVTSYEDYLLTIAMKQGDTKSVIQLAREAFVQQGDESYYLLLKNAIPANQWVQFVDSLLGDIRKSDYAPEMSAWVFAHEEMWDRLLMLVKENSPALAERYRADLEKRFPNDMVALYETFCLNILAHTGDRKGYQRACDYLRRVKALGQVARADRIKDTLREKYANRRALLDELNKV